MQCFSCYLNKNVPKVEIEYVVKDRFFSVFINNHWRSFNKLVRQEFIIYDLALEGEEGEEKN